MQTVYPYLRYRDVDVAADFLASAFGFRRVDVAPSARGHANHSHIEMAIDDGSRVRMTPTADEDGDTTRAGANSVMLQISVSAIDDHFARARAAGATIVTPLRERRYGDRGYVADDPEGHRWYFIERSPA